MRVVQECIYELARNPAIQTRLRTELADFRSRHGRFPGFEDLMSGSALPYFEAVIRETLRTKAVLREIGRMVCSTPPSLSSSPAPPASDAHARPRQSKTTSFLFTFPSPPPG